MQEEQTAKRQLAQMAHALRKDEGALAFCDQLFFVTQVWDDLVDRDKEVDAERVNRMMFTALVEIPQNPFYLRHIGDLRPLLRSFVNDWFDANELERGDAHDKSVSFVLRDTVGGIVCQCAYLVGGYAWMREVSPDIRRMIHDETLGDYLRGL